MMQEEQGIFISLYSDCQEHDCLSFTTPSRKYTAEELCLIAAKKIGLSPITFHLFGLVTPDLHLWLPPGKVLMVSDSSRQEYLFRLRFKLPFRVDSSNLWMLIRRDLKAFHYYFLQCRHDFVNDVLKTRYGTTLSTSHNLGLAVLDMFRVGVQNKMTSADQVLAKYGYKIFLPPSSLGGFNKLLDSVRLKKNFKDELDKLFTDQSSIQAQNLTSIKHRYLNGLFTRVAVYGSEFLQGKDPSENIWVDPHHETCPGIYTSKLINKKSVKEHLCKIEDIDFISVVPQSQHDFEVRIQSRNSSLKPLMFGKQEQMESFVSCVDGYCRLMKDFYYHPCSKITSPLLAEMMKSKCHGPVTPDWAKKQLEKRENNTPGTYLLKQSSHTFDQHTLFLVTQARIVVFEISFTDEDGYRLETGDNTEKEPAFEDLNALRRHYHLAGRKKLSHPTEGSIDFVLKTPLIPGKDQCPSILLCAPLLDDEDKEEKEKKDELLYSRTNTPYLVLETQIKKSEIHGSRAEHIGANQITKVQFGQLYFKGTDSSRWKEVAIKSLASSSPKLLEAFQQGVSKASAWTSRYIIKSHAICLDRPFRVLMEEARMGSLLDLLRNREKIFSLSHLVNIAEQLAEALMYLDENNFTHGNIRCRNVLACSENTDGYVVKLSDPGLIYFYSGLASDSVINIERLPWLAPELHNNFHAFNIESDVFAFGVTLWEILSVGARPLESESAEMTQVFFSSGRTLPIPMCCKPCMTDREEIADTKRSLHVLVNECTRAVASERKPTKSILRDIRQMQLNVHHRHDTMLYAVINEDSDHGYMNTDDRSISTDRQWCKLILDELSQEAADVAKPLKRPPTRQLVIPPRVGSREPQLPKAVPRHTTNDNSSDDLVDGSAHPVIFMSQRPLPPTPGTLRKLKWKDLIIDRTKVLGAGHYGCVYLGRYKPENRMVAVKQLKDDQKDYEAFFHEMKIMNKLNHPNVVNMIGATRDSKDAHDEIYLVMEFVGNGTVMKYIEQRKPDDHQLTKLSRDIAEGMAYLGSFGIVHRDLAARNVLVTFDHRAKISDFGLSRALDDNVYYTMRRTKGDFPIFWWAPECIQFHRFTTRSDVWSYGMVLWELFTRGTNSVRRNMEREIRTRASQRKMQPVETFLLMLHEGWHLPLPEVWPLEIREIIQSCWQINKEDRPLFINIRERLEEYLKEDSPAILLSSQMDLPSPTHSTDGSRQLLLPPSSPDSIRDSSAENYNSTNTTTTTLGDVSCIEFPIDVNRLIARPLPPEPSCQPVKEFDYSELKLERRLGQGHYGEVFKASCSPDLGFDVVAVKRLQVEVEKQSSMEREFQHEVNMMSRLNHECIVRILGTAKQSPREGIGSGRELWIVMEYVSHGDLKNYISNSSSTLRDLDRIRLARDIAEGMQYLHVNRIIHRDLAARNVLVTFDQRAKITDFGLSRQREESVYYYVAKSNRAVNPYWYSPEGIDPHNPRFASRSDVWSFGVVLWEIFSVHDVIDTYDSEILRQKLVPDVENKNTVVGLRLLLGKKWRLPIQPQWPEEIKKLMQDCWRYERKERPHFDQIKESLEDLVSKLYLV
ncbi:tyrosine-protein kinase JAK2 [Lingula anatina]|uniref:non-specific protein-tyrosine kinase n=1 Tax=Lingula anatina TaxID=7574 RepID=A0A1S3IPL9_LINAN|nr:tyrosine-protein kinase JAK2 [Lingula anatina]|eukprot:XP_013399489.1 tyrosine-protein kinase JAK2 [Lingula anatina]